MADTETSRVLFHDAHGTAKRSRLDKVRALFDRAGFAASIRTGDRVAVKIHWGEPGNVGFVPPPYVRTVVEAIRDAGGHPFITDTNTLYAGMRRNAVDNLQAAASNGFTQLTLGAPILVADGLTGKDSREVELPGSQVGRAKIASGILDADGLIVLSHVKGHMLMGFGGALKNLGMGCATPAGKQILHSDLRPRVDPDSCQGDAICIPHCPEACIELVDAPGDRKVARIEEQRCIGCGECTSVCPHGAIPVNWKTTPEAIQRKTAEYAKAAVAGKQGRVGFINFLIQITPDCDCCDWNDNPFAPDLGFAASADPVALDTASVDLVAQATPLPDGKAHGHTGDPWRAVWDLDYRVILEHAERIGLGRRSYDLVRLAG